MSTAAQIPLSEYLETTFRPDREYVDGEVLERNVGKWEHARIQWLLALWFGRHERDWNVIVAQSSAFRLLKTVCGSLTWWFSVPVHNRKF